MAEESESREERWWVWSLANVIDEEDGPKKHSTHSDGGQNSGWVHVNGKPHAEKRVCADGLKIRDELVLRAKARSAVLEESNWRKLLTIFKNFSAIHTKSKFIHNGEPM